MDTACESLHHSFIIKYRWLNAGETLSRTLGNSCVSSVSSHRFTLPCIRLIVSVITTYGYELYLCYVRGEQLDKLCFSASHLIRYWKMYNYVHMQCLCILWEIKHLNLNLTNRAEIPTPEVTTQHKHLRGVDLTDAEILFLIGRDLPDAHIVKDQRTGSTGQPIGQKLSLGWVVIGNVCLGPHTWLEHVIANKTNILPNGRPTSLCCPCPHAMNVKDHLTDGPPIVFDVFKKTRDDEKLGASVEDKKFISLMGESFKKGPTGNWVAPLPFKNPRNRLPDIREVARKRAFSLQKNLHRDYTKREHFVAFMQSTFDKGHAEVAPPLANSEESWYLPLFGVYHTK